MRVLVSEHFLPRIGIQLFRHAYEAITIVDDSRTGNVLRSSGRYRAYLRQFFGWKKPNVQGSSESLIRIAGRRINDDVNLAARMTEFTRPAGCGNDQHQAREQGPHPGILGLIGGKKEPDELRISADQVTIVAEGERKDEAA